jgi:peptidoglycan/LPS O-acetylase OafA/YrhL
MDIRGWTEMHPLDGPAWSLFFEYIANILYALFVRKFSKTALWIVVIACGAALIHFTVTSKNGDVIGGWALEPLQLRIGFTRMMYPYFAGLLLCRLGKTVHIKQAFLWSSLLIVLVLSIPRIGGPENVWMNGLYESLTIIFIFPLIVLLGAGGTVKGAFATRLCKFFGDISYPIYITHYPLIYIYTAWVANGKIPLQKAYPYGILVIVSAIVIAYACLLWYDEPVRKWLKIKVLKNN